MSDLTEDDKAILVELLRETIAADRFPCRHGSAAYGGERPFVPLQARRKPAAEATRSSMSDANRVVHLLPNICAPASSPVSRSSGGGKDGVLQLAWVCNSCRRSGVGRGEDTP